MPPVTPCVWHTEQTPGACLPDDETGTAKTPPVRHSSGGTNATSEPHNPLEHDPTRALWGRRSWNSRGPRLAEAPTRLGAPARATPCLRRSRPSPVDIDHGPATTRRSPAMKRRRALIAAGALAVEVSAGCGASTQAAQTATTRRLWHGRSTLCLRHVTTAGRRRIRVANVLLGDHDVTRQLFPDVPVTAVRAKYVRLVPAPSCASSARALT